MGICLGRLVHIIAKDLAVYKFPICYLAAVRPPIGEQCRRSDIGGLTRISLTEMRPETPGGPENSGLRLCVGSAANFHGSSVPQAMGIFVLSKHRITAQKHEGVQGSTSERTGAALQRRLGHRGR